MTPIKWNDDENGIKIGLPGDLDLAMAAPLAESLRSALATAKPVRVLADLVERIGSAPIQVLLAASKEAGRQEVQFIIDSPSEVFIETCDDLGLADWLQKWSAQ